MPWHLSVASRTTINLAKVKVEGLNPFELSKFMNTNSWLKAVHWTGMLGRLALPPVRGTFYASGRKLPDTMARPRRFRDKGPPHVPPIARYIGA